MIGGGDIEFCGWIFQLGYSDVSDVEAACKLKNYSMKKKMNIKFYCWK